MRTSERFNWLVLITFTTGIIIFILTQTIDPACEIMGDKLSLWRTQLNLGINTNWSGWDIDFEKYIVKCYGYQALVELDLR
jgi:hypothetical protein